MQHISPNLKTRYKLGTVRDRSRVAEGNEDKQIGHPLILYPCLILKSYLRHFPPGRRETAQAPISQNKRPV